MSEKLILMHENTPYFKIFPFLKPLGGVAPPPPPCGAAPVLDCLSSLTHFTLQLNPAGSPETLGTT